MFITTFTSARRKLFTAHIIIIIIIGKNTISSMQGIYTYIPQTNHVPKEHNVKDILSLRCMVAPALALLLLLLVVVVVVVVVTVSVLRGPGSSVGIATGYGLGGPGIESRWVRDFPHLSRLALGLTQPPVQYNGYRVFPGVASGRGVTLTPHPF
jgi:hypothetical protein